MTAAPGPGAGAVGSAAGASRRHSYRHAPQWREARLMMIESLCADMAGRAYRRGEPGRVREVTWAARRMLKGIDAWPYEVDRVYE